MKMYDINEFRATKKWPYAISAGCVIYRTNNGVLEVLLLKRNPTHSHNPESQVAYNLPKGHVGFNETLLETAIRETEEEAGCRVKIQTYLGSIHRSFVHPVHKNHNEKTTHYFAALWLEDTHAIDSEHDDKQWFTQEAAIEALESVKTGVLRNETEVIKRLKQFLELENAA